MTAPPMPAMSEAQFQQRIIDYCRLLQLLVWHDFDSRRNAAGFPDLIIVGNRVLYVELKAKQGRLSAEQHIWLDRLRAAAGDAAVAVWRPDDWEIAAATLRNLR